MSIVFKTYNRKHQLHLYQETWVFSNKAQLDEVLGMFNKKELPKAEVKPVNETIEVTFNGVIIDCHDLADLKKKFGLLADLKEKYQKQVVPQVQKGLRRPASRRS